MGTVSSGGPQQSGYILGLAGESLRTVRKSVAWLECIGGEPRAMGKMLRGPCDFRESQGVLPAVLYLPFPHQLPPLGMGCRDKLAIKRGDKEARCEEARFSPAQPRKMCVTEMGWEGNTGQELPYHGPRYRHLNKT